MAVSLECRPALLSTEVVEFAFSLPDTFTYAKGELKGGFREALAPMMPSQVVGHAKQGFSVPDSGWRSDLIRRHGSVQEGIACAYLPDGLVDQTEVAGT